MVRTWVACSALLAALAIPALAQEKQPPKPAANRLINLDAPGSPPAGLSEALVDVRPFGSEENNVSGTLQIGYGVTDNIAVMLRGVLAEKKTLNAGPFSIRHGGTDYEFLVKVRPPLHRNLAIELGVSHPQTAATGATYGTAQILYRRPFEKASIYLAPKAAFAGSNTLLGIGGGVSVKLGDSFELIGDVTGLISGNNTTSVITGGSTRGEVWGVGVRYRPVLHPELSADIGATNGLGGTTALSMTPGLGGSTAVYGAIRYVFHDWGK